MSHTSHPDVHEAGLADDCPRCAEHAEHPTLDLDEAMLADLAWRAVGRACGDPLPHRSVTELVAETAVLNLLERVGRLAEVAPDAVARYLREKWRLDAEIANPRAAEVAAFLRGLEGPKP